MVSSPGSPLAETESGAPAASRTTSEQVASKPMPAIAAGSTPERSTASRTEAHTQRQMSSDSCSA